MRQSSEKLHDLTIEVEATFSRQFKGAPDAAVRQASEESELIRLCFRQVPFQEMAKGIGAKGSQKQPSATRPDGWQKATRDVTYQKKNGICGRLFENLQ